MRKLILLLTMVCMFPLVGECATYYVKNGGNDSADGLSDSNAWETMDKIESSTSSGDTVFLKRGSSWSDRLSIPDNNINIFPYGNGDNPSIEQLALFNKSNCTVEGITCNATTTRNAGTIESGDDNLIVDCVFDGNNLTSNHVVVTYGQDANFATRNTFKRCVFKNGGDDTDILCGLSINQRSSYILVEDCVAYGSTDNNMQTYDSQAGTEYAPHHITFRRNECYGSGEHGIEIGTDVTSSVAEQNYIHDNTSGNGILVVDNNGNTIRNNIIINTQEQIASYGSADSNYFLNNVLIDGNNTVKGFFFRSGNGNNNEVKNNIIIGKNVNFPEVQLEGANTIISDNNCFYDINGLRFESDSSVYNSLSAWQTATSGDSNSINSNPRLTPTNRLSQASPCRGTGTNGSDMGAYKYYPGISTNRGSQTSTMSGNPSPGDIARIN